MKNIITILLLFISLFVKAQDPKPIPYNADFKGYIRVQSLRAKVSPTASMGYVLVDTTNGQEYSVSRANIESNFIYSTGGNNVINQPLVMNDSIKFEQGSNIVEDGAGNIWIKPKADMVFKADITGDFDTYLINALAGQSTQLNIGANSSSGVVASFSDTYGGGSHFWSDKFGVIANTGASALILDAQQPTQAILMRTGKGVGINTTNPTKTLDVNGNIKGDTIFGYVSGALQSSIPIDSVGNLLNVIASLNDRIEDDSLKLIYYKNLYQTDSAAKNVVINNKWGNSGNAFTFPNNKIGTTVDADFRIICKNVEVFRSDSLTGNVSFKGAIPSASYGLNLGAHGATTTGEFNTTSAFYFNGGAGGLNGSKLWFPNTSFGGNITNGISLDGSVSVDIRQARSTSGDGNPLTISSGGGKTATANVRSGALILKNDQSTGIGNSYTALEANGNNRTSTTDNASYMRTIIMNTELLRDNFLDTLFSVTLGADSIFTGTLEFNAIVSDDDSNQIEKGKMLIGYIRNGNKSAIITNTAIESMSFLEILTSAIETNLSFIYAYATSKLYVCATVNTSTGNNLGGYTIQLNTILTNGGGKYTGFTQH
jgi:hypothetical protein